jgi:hypothetical protein
MPNHALPQRGDVNHDECACDGGPLRVDFQLAEAQPEVSVISESDAPAAANCW